MPQDKKNKALDPSLKTVTKSINDVVGQRFPSAKKKKPPTDDRSIFSPSKIFDDTRRGLSGLKYLPDYLTRKR